MLVEDEAVGGGLGPCVREVKPPLLHVLNRKWDDCLVPCACPRSGDRITVVRQDGGVVIQAPNVNASVTVRRQHAPRGAWVRAYRKRGQFAARFPAVRLE